MLQHWADCNADSQVMIDGLEGVIFFSYICSLLF